MSSMTLVALSLGTVAIVAVSGLVPRWLKTRRRLKVVAPDPFHDPLTMLPNRAWMLERLEQALARARRHGHVASVLTLNIDRFAAINNRMGHDWGDAVLRQVARKLVEAARQEDTVTRLDGDQFGILLESVADTHSAARVAKRIIESFRAPLNIGGNDVIITFSIGVAVDTAGDATPRELLLNASLAMERAKKKGKGRFEIFDRELGKQAIHRLNLETRLRQAPFAGEMRVHYQPEVLLESGRIAGMEALVRWQHPVHGLLGPDKFIPMAEETGLIVRVGRWILGEALATLGAIRRLTPLEDAFHLSVNVSVAQLEHDPDFLDHLGEVLAAEGILPGHLVIEITETAQEMEPLVEVLEQIRMMGVGVAIDDFGTGYSSLSRLKSLPASVVKVDQRFVRGIQDPANLAIVRSVVDLASVLNLEVTAEGIETPRQLELVRSAGCNRGCGYYFSKPVPREQLMELLVHGVLPAARFTTAAALPALPAAPPAPHQPSPLSGT